jgi:hypothetical protein
MATALADANLYSFQGLSPVSQGSLAMASLTPRGYMPGGVAFIQSPFGLKLVEYIQNRTTTAYVQGALVSSLGDTDGKTQVTASGAAGVNTTKFFTTSGLTADAHVGGYAYVLNSTAGTGFAPEGEAAIVVANSATIVTIDSMAPLSATFTTSDTIDLGGMWNTELSADGDIAAVVRGVVLPSSGIPAGYYGWVCRHGRCPNTLLKAATALTQNDALVADAGRVGPALGAADVANLHVGYAPHVVNSDTVPDKTLAYLTLGFGFNPGTIDASA